MEASVHSVCSTGLNSILVPRLSLQAAVEKIDADNLIASISLHQQQDERNSFFAAVGNLLDTGQLYRASTQSGERCQSYEFVWKNYAPPRVKFFGWLLLQERIQCRANLAKKNILDSDTRELCGQSAENCDYLIFHCPVANSFWTHLGWDSASLPQVHRL